MRVKVDTGRRIYVLESGGQQSTSFPIPPLFSPYCHQFGLPQMKSKGAKLNCSDFCGNMLGDWQREDSSTIRGRLILLSR